MQDVFVAVDNVSVLKQWRVPTNSDYVAPPAGYSLFNATMGFVAPIKQKKLSVAITVNNITNVSYRDYLNHFRYYSDELGVNFIIRTKLSF
jgi:iron complex outermembrane receptor protein